jgi:hypothetical protein
MGNNIFIIFSRNTQQNTTKLVTFELSSRLIVERHLLTIASDAYGIGFVEEIRTTRDQYCGCGVNKEVKENNNNNKKPNPILAFYIQTRGAQTTI